jgi:hypothetical protein
LVHANAWIAFVTWSGVALGVSQVRRLVVKVAPVSNGIFVTPRRSLARGMSAHIQPYSQRQLVGSLEVSFADQNFVHTPLDRSREWRATSAASSHHAVRRGMCESAADGLPKLSRAEFSLRRLTLFAYGDR